MMMLKDQNGKGEKEIFLPPFISIPLCVNKTSQTFHSKRSSVNSNWFGTPDDRSRTTWNLWKRAGEFTAFMSQIISSLFTERTEILFAVHTEYPGWEGWQDPRWIEQACWRRKIMVLLFTRMASWQIKPRDFSSKSKSSTVHPNFVPSLLTFLYRTQKENLWQMFTLLFSLQAVRLSQKMTKQWLRLHATK